MALHSQAVSKRFLELIPREFARRHLVVSQGMRRASTAKEADGTRDVPGDGHEVSGDEGMGGEVLVVAPNSDPAAIFNVGVRLNAALSVQEADGESIAQVIDEAYGRNQQQSGLTVTALSGGVSPGGSSDVPDVAALLAQAGKDLLSTEGKGPVVRLVDAFLFEAITRGASDIHIQPLADRALIRYRVDGVLHDVHELTPPLTTAVVSRIKVMGRMDIAERRIPQDGRTAVTIGSRPIDVRLSTLPTSYGERAVLRLLDAAQALSEFMQLGMPEAVSESFLERAKRPNGIILVTGPTGSGKTTTLYATLRRIASPAVNIMTIEDPIEYELSTIGLAVSQAQVNLKKGVSFAGGLRHILRQDPDIIMVGEIRDAETARIAIQSSLTGHLVLSTLHTNDAASAITRLIDLGVEPYLVGASLSAVLAQRLVRTVHDTCKGRGCAECFHSGLKGRTGVFELLTITEPIRELILRRASAQEIRAQAQRSAAPMRTLFDEGERLIDEGRTTPIEVRRVIQEEEP